MTSKTAVIQQKIAAAKETLEDLKKQVEKIKIDKFSGGLPYVYKQRVGKSEPLPEINTNIKCRRTLRGHFGKVYSSQWSGDSAHLVSASQDGKLIVWNGYTTNKIQSIPLKSSWVITCGFEQSLNRYVASGGLDNICSIYKLGNSKIMRVTQELNGHTGYLSSFCFLNETNIITGSGDSRCLYWDIEKGIPTVQYTEHIADVMSVAVDARNPNIFASGSVDTTVKIWDIRSGKSTHTFNGHNTDVNSVCFLANGNSVVSGSDDPSIRVFDLRCCGEVSTMCYDRVMSGITGVACSNSGRILFSSHEDHFVRGWDMLSEAGTPPVLQFSGHENRVSGVGVSPDGTAILSGSWDTFLKIWA